MSIKPTIILTRYFTTYIVSEIIKIVLLVSIRFFKIWLSWKINHFLIILIKYKIIEIISIVIPIYKILFLSLR